MFRVRSRLLSVCLSALLFISVSAASPPAHAKKQSHAPQAHSTRPVNNKIVEQPAPDPGGSGVLTLDGQWQLVDVPAGTTVTAQDTSTPPTTTTSDQHVYVLNGPDGVLASPLPDTIKNELVPTTSDGGVSISSEDGGTDFYMVSQEIAEGIDASETAGELTPEIAAIAEPLDDSGTSGSVTTESAFGGSCAPKPQFYPYTLNLSDKTYTKDLPLSGSFSGSVSITGHISGTIHADTSFDIKRKNVLGFCVPYGAKFKTLHAYGTATSNGGIDLTGTVNYSGTFGPWDIAKPDLYSFWVYPYGIPVKIGFNLPITSGLSLSATATGTLNYNGTHVANGTFDYTCTLDSCTGTHTFENTPDSSSQEITGGVSGHVKPTPYVDVAVRAYLYSDSIAYAQIGVRPYLLGDLWLYDGNACGDADGDAVNETVRALTFDLDRRIDLTGKANIFSSNVWDQTIQTGTVKHVGFYDLIGSSAMQPLFQGTPGLDPGATGQYKMRIRPCWPYTDQVTYQVDFGDGSTPQTFQGAPGTDVQVSHSWSAEGSPTVTATSVSDQHGRSLNAPYSRTLQIKALGATITPTPGSATYGLPITWTVTPTGGDPTTIKYAFFRRLAGTTPWTPDVTAANWQTSNTLTWTPAAADVGVWEIYVWVKDGATAANANTYGYTVGLNPGPVQVVPPLAVTCPPAPVAVTYGTALSFTASSTGGTPGTIQYTVGHQLTGSSNWLPSPLVWQASNVLPWTPTVSEVGAWTVAIGVRDVNTAPNANGLGYSAACTVGTIRVVTPLSVSITPSPASSVYGNPITWTATPSGGDAPTIQYAFFHRRAGTVAWTPDVTAPAWQTSSTFTWTPTLADAGGQPWEVIVWAKDAATPATMNSYGYAAYANAGTVQVTTPPLTLSTTASPAYSTAGNPITWTLTAAGGNPNTRQYAFFRRIAGTTAWTPDVTAPVWQSGNTFTWTPTSANVGTWEIIFWVKDGDTPATQNTYGYGAYVNAGTVQVVAPLTVTCNSYPPSAVSYGTTLNWAPTANGGVPGTIQYTVIRQLAGTTAWLPSPAVWQSSNALSWTPGASDVGTWQFSIMVKDANTPASPGYAAYCGAGQVKVTAPLTLSITPSPAYSTAGNAITWTATAGGGTPATYQYAFFRRRAGTTPWTPDVTAPAWQAGNSFTWTPTSADTGTWEIIVWAKDGDTPATQNTYGYSAYVNAGTVTVVAPLTLSSTPTSPAVVTAGTTLSWTLSSTGGVPGTVQYTLARQLSGTSNWLPSPLVFQSGNVMTWTPTTADVGTWTIGVGVRDSLTSPTANGFGVAASALPGTVRVVAPITFTLTPSPSTSPSGTAITWTATASGGDTATLKYAFFRRRAGTTPWTPDVTAANWQTSNVFNWTPAAADAGTWEIVVWVKDGTTAATANTYGYAAYANAGPVQVYNPLTLTTTNSPSSAVYGTTVSWTATASGGTAGTYQYAFFRRRLGTTPWTPDVTAAAWQASNVMSWTPASADTGTWEIVIWVKDANTPATQNTYGYGAYYNAGTLLVTAPLSLRTTASPASSPAGTTLSWTLTASGGNPSTTKYAFFRRRAGTTPWTPDVTAANWQTSNTVNWTPTAADAGTWEIIFWVKDGATPATMNTYGYAAYVNAGTVQVYNPITLTGTGSPSSAVYNTTVSWTATPSGGTAGTFQYAFFRRRLGTTPWTPDVTAAAWQTSNVMSWTPTSADTGTWEIIIWVKDAYTPATQNTYGYGAYYNAGTLLVTAPLSLSVTPSPSSSHYGTTINWTATASGGNPATTRYAFFRRIAGTPTWTPDVTAPNWQSGNTFSWTPTAGDVATWEIIIWVKDGATPATMNTYGFAAYSNAGPVQITP
jgi:hypothetical protein